MNTDTLTPTVRGACPHDCPDTCALLTEVQDGRAVKVLGNPAHPLTAGVLCTKVSRYAERVYHPERLLQPLRRVGPKGSGRFEPVAWDDALRDIAQRLAEVARQDPQAILPYSYAGTMGQVQGEAMASRFFARLGTSSLDRTICSSAGKVGLTYTHGAPVGMPVETFAQSRLIWIWGSNAIGSHLHFWRLAQQAKRAGAKLVCIDPRRTETADKCDQHVALRPGTDAALALGIAHQLVVNDWLDHDYLAAHTEGFEALRERALQWPAARVAQVCGIDEQVVHEMAHDYAHIQPAGIRANYGMQRARGGGNAMRAVFALPCLTGAWRQPGGGALLSNAGWFPRRATDEITPLLRSSLGQRAPRVINMSTIADDLLRESSPEFGPKIQALVVYNSNPVAVAPDSARVVKGFARQDLFTVVLEQFQTDTADYADYVLPATTQLEHWDIHASYGHTDIVLNQPAIAPQGQAKPNTEVFRALARLLGFDEPCFARDDRTLCRDAFELNDDQWQQLLHDGFYRLPVPAAPFAEGGFFTPSGKAALSNPHMTNHGLDPTPDYVEPAEAMGSAAYPLAMISPPARHFLNSTFVNVRSLRDIEGEPLLEIHPQDAADRGIQDGDEVAVFNQRGTYHCTARLSTRARPGVVHGLGIWWRKLGRRGTNVNEVVGTGLTDMGRAPLFYDVAVQVAKAS